MSDEKWCEVLETVLSAADKLRRSIGHAITCQRVTTGCTCHAAQMQSDAVVEYGRATERAKLIMSGDRL